MVENTEKPNSVADDVVVTMDYTVRVDGDVVDTSEGYEPIQFIQGTGQIVPGLERELYGMAIGDQKNVVVSAAEGYGEEDPDARMEVPRGEFPSEIPLEEGVELQIKTQDGQEYPAYITSLSEESVQLNFNHPLAGKELHFDVQVLDLRPATDEELSHGHVHHGHEH